MKTLRKLRANEVTFKIKCLVEHIPVRGNALFSEDPEVDKEEEDRILQELESNEWAWCCVRVTAVWRQFSEHDYLGACSYKNEEDFKRGGYYECMKKEALEALNDHIRLLWEDIQVLQE